VTAHGYGPTSSIAPVDHALGSANRLDRSVRQRDCHGRLAARFWYDNQLVAAATPPAGVDEDEDNDENSSICASGGP
jgi:hypothetical protein